METKSVLNAGFESLGQSGNLPAAQLLPRKEINLTWNLKRESMKLI